MVSALLDGRPHTRAPARGARVSLLLEGCTQPPPGSQVQGHPAMPSQVVLLRAEASHKRIHTG